GQGAHRDVAVDGSQMADGPQAQDADADEHDHHQCRAEEDLGRELHAARGASRVATSFATSARSSSKTRTSTTRIVRGRCVASASAVSVPRFVLRMRLTESWSDSGKSSGRSEEHTSE